MPFTVLCTIPIRFTHGLVTHRFAMPAVKDAVLNCDTLKLVALDTIQVPKLTAY